MLVAALVADRDPTSFGGPDLRAEVLGLFAGPSADVGPWLPFQMICSARIGLGAGLLPRRVRGAPLLDNLHRFGIFTLLTSTGGWDTGRAITTGIAIAVLGPAILTTLRRAARRAVVRPG